MMTLSARRQLEEIFSDVYKEAYGFRPRGIDVTAWSDDELEARVAALHTIALESHEDDF